MNAARNALMVLLWAACASALAAPASERSVRQLLDVTQARKLVDSVGTQLDSVMENSIRMALNGQTPSAAQQQAIERMKGRMVALERGELTWAKLEPMYLRLYRDAFTEEEVAGMLSFYRTQAGQAVIHKMPLLMRRTMLEVQRMMSEITPQMRQILQDFAADMKAAGK